MASVMKRLVVLALLAVWCFPAVSFAKSEPEGPPPLPALVTSGSRSVMPGGRAPGNAEAAQLAAREKQNQTLQDFKAGEGVSIYVGGGVVTLLLLVLLIVVLT